MNSEVQYHYTLATKTKKHICPACRKKSFVPFIDTVKGEIMASFGRCDREMKCGYFEKPPPETLALFVPAESIREHSEKSLAIWQNGNRFFIAKKAVFEQLEAGLYVAEYFLKDTKGIRETECPSYVATNGKYFAQTETGSKPKAVKAKPKEKESEKLEPIPFEVLHSTLTGYEENQFIQNLLQNVPFPFEPKAVEKVISLYYLGTIQSGFRKGAITFPFIDLNNEIRAIQVKEFDNSNHSTGTGFLHSLLAKQYEKGNKPLPDWLNAYLMNSSKVSCLFGEHLLKQYPGKPIALVEAPKTAIYGTLYFGFPEELESFLWLAAYNKTSFNFDKMKALQGRTIFTFPDLSRNGNTFKEWQAKAKEMEGKLPGTRFIFSNLLEELASETDKEQGKDIADFLISLNWKDFRPKEEKPGLQAGEKSEKSEYPKTTFKISEENELGRIEKEISRIETAISEQQGEINRLTNECKALENTFIQASERCQLKWYSNSITKEPQGKDRLLQLIYWTS